MSETLVNQLKAIIAEELDVNLKEKFNFMFSDSELSPEFFSNLSVLANLIGSKLATVQ
jgi:acyl carrier protein